MNFSVLTDIKILNTVEMGFACIIFLLFFKMELSIPDTERKTNILHSFLEDLRSYTHKDENDVLKPVVCCVCDGIPTRPQWSTWVSVERLRKLCVTSKMQKTQLSGIYPEELINQYTAPHEDLKAFVLSPASQVNREMDSILICEDCLSALQLNNEKKRSGKIYPPKESIANGYLLGEPPTILKSLNAVELAIVSRVQVHCQTWVFFAGCHQHIKGWHCFFRNRNESNVGSVQMLGDSGMNGNILVVLCGPFTSQQKALTLAAVNVNVQKVLAGFDWMKRNNFYHKDERIPEESEIPIPVILDDSV